MEALYVDNNEFSVTGDKTSEFSSHRRLKLDCDADGVKYASVVSSTFTSVTSVIIDENVLTSNLIDVLYSVVKVGEFGNLPDHYHTSSEGDGGLIYGVESFSDLNDTLNTYSGSAGLYAQSTGSGIIWAEGSDIHDFIDLNDTPATFSGAEGKYLISTGSGIEFQDLPEFSTTFLDLNDTATTYSGSQYLRTTSSGIEFIDGVIITAPNDSEWIIRVTNSGTLYTESF